MHPHLQQSHGNKLRVLWENLERPVTMLFKSLICFILSLYMALSVFPSQLSPAIYLT